MNLADIRKLSVEDLQAKIEEAEKQYQTVKMGHKISPIQNPISIRKERRDIARYKTVLTEKLAEQK